MVVSYSAQGKRGRERGTGECSGRIFSQIGRIFVEKPTSFSTCRQTPQAIYPAAHSLETRSLSANIKVWKLLITFLD